MDPSSVMWMYHSHVNEDADTNMGLMGAIVINRAGAARSTNSTSNKAPLASDIDQDAVLFFTVLDEFTSRYTMVNTEE